MTYTDLIETIQEGGDPRALESITRLGITFNDRYYGWNLTQIAALARQVNKHFEFGSQIKNFHELALKLWETGVLDCKLLSAHIEQPDLVTEEQIDAQIIEIDYIYLVDKYVQLIVGKTPYAEEKMTQWINSDKEMILRAGWDVVIGLANTGGFLDSFFEQLLEKIKNEIQTSPNWAKEKMNWALIQIGARNKRLNELAISVAKSVGPIVVDYGDTNCTTPNALGFLTGRKVKDKLKRSNE